MQNLKYSLVILLAMAFSCQLEELNVNPNDPVDVPMEVLLPPVQQSVANILSGDGALISSIHAQHLIGYEALVQPLDRYVIDNNFFMRPVWQDLYVTAMPTLKIITEKAEATDSPHYGGIAKVLQALMLGTATDWWGDIPYSEAFQGVAELEPVFDDQEALYQTIFQLLDEAIVDLENPESLLTPGDVDLFYAGDTEKWVKAAHSLKARYLLHTWKRDATVLPKVLDALADGISDPGEDLAYTFNQQEFNPWYQYLQSTPNIRVDENFRDAMDDDPRENLLIDFVFGEAYPGPAIAEQFIPLNILSFAECKLIEAEVLVRLEQSGAQEALNQAIQTHMDQVGQGAIDQGEVDNYLANKGQLSGDLEEDLHTILREKWIVLFLNPEAWTEYRRTGYPDLPPNENGMNPQNPNGEIPRRFPYPLNEFLYNSNTPDPLPNLQDRFWWDEA
jgi:hypothetical protein